MGARRRPGDGIAIRTLPLRLLPGQDLRRKLEDALARDGDGAFVLSGIGSPSEARIWFAGAVEPEQIDGDLEVVSLSSTIATNGSHQQAVVSTAKGDVFGGHLGYGCIVRKDGRGAACRARRVTAQARGRCLDRLRRARDPAVADSLLTPRCQEPSRSMSAPIHPQEHS